MKAVYPNTISIIPARGGSVGLYRKNLKLLLNIPLITHTIRSSIKSPWISRTYVSSEDTEILDIARSEQADTIIRPLELAQNDILSSDVILHALNSLGNLPDYFILLQPTSPLRTEEHINDCMKEFLLSGCINAVSVTEAEHHPFKMLIENQQLIPIRDFEDMEKPRQKFPKAWRPNGAIYIGSPRDFIKNPSFFGQNTFFYKMSQDCSFDIDSELDIFLVESIMKRTTNHQFPKPALETKK